MRQHVEHLLYGPEHEYWKLRVAAHLRSSGYEVAVDAPVGSGRTIDLVATGSSERLAVEIEASTSEVVENVRKCLAAGYASIRVLATRGDLASELRSQLRSAESLSAADVRVVDASRFVQAPSPPGRERYGD